MKKELNKTKLLVTAILCNIVVLGLLVGLALLIIHFFMRGRLPKTLISIFGVVFFTVSVLTTGLVYRFYLRRVYGKEQLDDLIKAQKKKAGEKRE